nr:hypothetical protein [Streptomyces sp. 846.5]
MRLLTSNRSDSSRASKPRRKVEFEWARTSWQNPGSPRYSIYSGRSLKLSITRLHAQNTSAATAAL